MRHSKAIWLAIMTLFLFQCTEEEEPAPLPVAGFTYTINEDIGEVTFLNTSENAISYAWDFGDGTTSNEIRPVKTFTSGTYVVKMTATSRTGATDTFEDTITISVKEAMSLPISFDDSNVDYIATTFEGATFEIVDNPDPSGSNDQASKVGAITNSGAAFEGLFFDLANPIDFAAQKSVSMHFWSDAPITVLMKLEEGTEGPIETTATHEGSGWEMIAFDFTSEAKYSRLTLFVDGPGTTAGTFYMDEIRQTATTVEEDTTPPVITLNGEATINLNVGDAFNDPGATATDNIDGDISGSIVVGGSVDTSTEGTYTLTYDVTDMAGNAAEQVTRTVIVTAVPNENLFPIDFENGAEFTGAFEGGANGENTDNPDQSGTNTSAKVYQFNKVAGAAWYSGMFNIFDKDIDPDGGKAFKMKIWSPKANINVRFQLEKEGSDGAVVTYQVDQTLSEANTWVEMTFDFSDTPLDLANGYDKIVIFPDYDESNQEPVATEAVYYVDDIDQEVSSGTGGGGGGGGGTGCTETELNLPIDFDCEGTDYAFEVFNGAEYDVVDNPDLSGANATASKVGKIMNSGVNWEGGAFTLANPISLATDKTITIKVWSQTALPVLLKLEGAGDPTEVAANHGGSGWEELSFTFESGAEFNKVVIFIDGPGTTAGDFYIDDIVQTSGGSGGGGGGGGTGCTDTALNLPIDFDCEGTDYAFEVFNGASYDVVDNPDLSGANATASKVGKIMNSGVNWEGGAFTLANPISLATDNTITMKVWSQTALPVLLKLEGAGDPTEVAANHGGTGWEDLSFTFSSAAEFNKVVIFIDGPGTTAGDFYIDDIVQTSGGSGGGGGGGGTGGGSGTVLSTNGDFEAGEEGWVLFDNGGTAKIDNTINNGGTASGRLEISGPGNPALKQERIGAGDVQAGNTIRITFDHLGSVTQPGAVFNVLLFGEAGNEGGASFTHVFNPAPSLSDNWTTFTGTFTIPNGTDVGDGVSFLIEAVCGGDAGCSVTANIDNVSVIIE